MESTSVCEPCTSQDKTSMAVKLCSDCEEKLCKDCVNDHSKFKAFKSHHLIDLSTTGSLLSSLAKHCDLHGESLLDLYCSEHSVACCRSCIPIYHQTCKDVLPIDIASRNIKDSEILQKTLEKVLKSLVCLMENRDNNIKKFEDCKSVILTQVRKFKQHFIKMVDKIEGNIFKDLSCMKQRHEIRLNGEKKEIARYTSEVLEDREQIELLQEHGSNNQLLLAIQRQEEKVQAMEWCIEKMIANFFDINYMVFFFINLLFTKV